MTPSEWYSATENEYINKRYIMFGIGNGEYINEVLSRCKTEVKILVYEPSASGVGQNEEDYRGLKELSKASVEVYVEGKEEDTFTNFIYEHVDYSSLQGMVLLIHPNYKRDESHTDELSQALIKSEKMFMNAVSTADSGIRASRYVKERFGEEAFENMMRNYSMLKDSKSLSSLIEGIDEDIPAIIVASGPSLSKNMHLLRKAKGRSFIISADSAVSALLANDIIPDIYLSVDPHKEAKSFEDDRVKDIPAIVELTSAKSAIKEGQEHFFLFNSGNTYLEEFLDKESVDMHLIGVGGSVANTCFDAAIVMGFKTIIFIGLDLAYTGNKTHVENTARYGMKIDESTAVFVSDIYGDTVKSSGEFILYKTLIEDEIMANPQVQVIDATEGGAKIDGAEVIPFAEAIDRYCGKEFNASELVAKADFLFDEEKKEKLEEHISKIPNEIRTLGSDLRKNLNNYDEMYMMGKRHNLNKNRLTKIMSDNDKLSERINSSSVLGYIELLAQDAIHDVQENAYKHNKDVYEEITEAASIGKVYAEGMLGGVSKALKIIEA